VWAIFAFRVELRSKQVLVTGAGGFIGSHLVEALVARGASVRAFIRYTSRLERGWLDQLPEGTVEDIEIVAGDIKDPDAVNKAVRGCDLVFHLAALIGIPYSYIHPRDYVETNVVGTTNVLSSARDFGTGRVVHISTSEVYGTARYVPIDEKHPMVGQSPYSASKIGADMLAESFHRSFDLPIVIVRPFNTFGPRQSLRAVIPTIINQLMQTGKLRLGTITPTRDFTFVSDTVDGIIAGAQSDDAVGLTINLGTGSEISIGDLAEKIAALVGVELTLEAEDTRLRPAESEVERLLSNNTLAKNVLNWEPKVSFDDGLVRTIDWFRKHPVSNRVTEYIT
jgi:dTDP-glucose 4,6-dehydratase